MKQFRTILAPVTSEQKIQRSRFLCFLFPIHSVFEAQELLSEHQKAYANATHNCHAYIHGFMQETKYYSDAGEPHGSAGKPMLNALLRNDLTNVLAIVTRYYGGVKLGVKGLIAAYGGAVEEAIQAAELTIALPQVRIRIRTEYAQVEKITAFVKDLAGEVIATEWGAEVHLTIRLPETGSEQLQEFLDGLRAHSSIDYQMEKE